MGFHIKTESGIIDQLATSIVYASLQLGGGPDEEEATRSLIENAIVIVEDAMAAGWEPPEKLAKALLEMLPTEQET